MAASTSHAPLAAIFGLSGPKLTDDERAFFASIRPVGYILFARNVETPAQVRGLVAELRAVAPGDDPLVLIDQEGGRVQRLRPPHWRFAPPMADFGALFATNPDAAVKALTQNMQLIGQDLAALGIDVDCAPVLDVPVADAHDIIGDRAFGADPTVVARLGIAAAEGLIAAGIVPVIKHIPGHGRARSDSHLVLPVVESGLADLRATDFAPFAAYARSGVSAFAMTAHVVYSAIDPERPATTSPKVIGDFIRGEIGFDGLLMSDDLGMKALAGPFDRRSAAALTAGCDVVLHCDGTLDDMRAVARGSRPLNADGARRLAAVAAIRRRPASVLAAAPTEVTIINALRRG